ncbi:MAG: DegT/DnrJ/EryC1/StrS family aminotransferase [Candidatus Aureabacteria bacterium]|nr:DegT/DnrJ/EryC1/StrS family aminotransferase [Candidatus Auribacterota bacterium]
MQFIDLQKQYQAYKNEIDKEIHEVLDTSQYILGGKVTELEEKLASYAGVKHALGVSSGTDALLMALMAKGIEGGDEIITTPFTFIATAEVISLVGAKPVFADIREDTYNIDPSQIRDKITPHTKGIIGVDIFGQCADYDEINQIAEENSLFVIEDAAQSFGAEYKGKKSCSLAEITCTSFFPAKPLGCYGDGGMVFTDDDYLYNKMKSIRVHGQGSDKYDNIRIGINGRLDTLQAAVLLAKLPHFDEELEKRQGIARYYNEKLKDFFITPKVLDFNLSVYAQYCLRTKKREDVLKKLKESYIPTAIYYPRPLHLMAAYENLPYMLGDFPISEKVAEEIFALPMHPFLNQEEQDKIIKALLG